MAENDPTRGDTRSRPVEPSGGASGAETGWAVTGTLMSGMFFWGGAGWLLDRWLDVRFLAPVGIILGMAMAVYLVVVRYGTVSSTDGERPSTTPGGRRSRPRTQKGQR